MILSAPIYQLKRRAKRLAREENISHVMALNTIAAREGFPRWSLLIAACNNHSPVVDTYKELKSGDLVLIGARPGHGKTLFSLELLIEAVKSGLRTAFFTLEYTEADIHHRFKQLNCDFKRFSEQIIIDCSDEICANYIIAHLGSTPAIGLIVIDYLQILDQDRKKDELAKQIETLAAYAALHGLIVVFISQIDRAYNSANQSFPSMSDVRLPNPVDLSLFNKACFLHNRVVTLHQR